MLHSKCDTQNDERISPNFDLHSAQRDCTSLTSVSDNGSHIPRNHVGIRLTPLRCVHTNPKASQRPLDELDICGWRVSNRPEPVELVKTYGTYPVRLVQHPKT